MNLESIKANLEAAEIFHSESAVLDRISVIGYEKKFKWRWFATQLNTFIVATDFGEEKITVELIEQHLSAAFLFSGQNHRGWPRGMQAAVAVISVLISANVSDEAKEYCHKLKSGKKWAGFTIPVAHDGSTSESFHFEKSPLWGSVYFPHFRKLIDQLK